VRRKEVGKVVRRQIFGGSGTRKGMKRQLLSGVALSAVATVLCASVPEQAQAQPPSWTGFYIGLNAGGAFGQSKARTNIDCSIVAPGAGYWCDSTGDGAANATAINSSGSGTINRFGFIAGGQVGYLWQQNQMVYGVETDLNSFNLNGSRQASGIMPVSYGPGGAIAGTTYNISNSFNTSWLYTLRGRVGWLPKPDMLAYVTGGLAVTRLGVSFNYSDTFPVSTSGSGSATKTGFALGGGLEWALKDHWTAKVEYLFVDFSSVTATGNITGYGQAISTSGDLTAHIARLGVNYKF